MHPFTSIHLFKRFYHEPAFNLIGRKGGFTSLGFFLSFLRKNLIFAGMTRMQMHLFEEMISDLNKDLNPMIKQRKIEVRANKLKHLMTPVQFIRYGRSEYVQHLIRQFDQFKGDRNNMMTRRLAIQFRDYIITRLTIANGLRASNIIELKVNDFENAKVVQGYEGHKVISNSSYKTSTIYGEKFIVISDILFDHCLFYINHLRCKINSNNKSTRMFLAASSSAQMTQTNVSCSVTASFSLAKVFAKDEYTRVCCTRGKVWNCHLCLQ